jgi:hypothetical protein
MTFHLGHVVQAVGLLVMTAGGFMAYESVKLFYEAFQILDAINAIR